MERKIGCGTQLVDIFVKQHIQEMHKFARENGFLNPMGVREKKRRLDAQRKIVEERAREAAGVQMQVMKDLAGALCVSE